MIKLSGVLTIKTITGRNGDFRVGRLITELGEFSVKDAVLDQYDEGRYEGEFGVNRIYPSHYSAAGRLVVEIRAELGVIALSNIELKTQQETQFEQDPLDEERKKRPPRTQKASSSSSNTDDSALPFGEHYETMGSASTESEADSDENQLVADDKEADQSLQSLFGLLWPLGDQVKLDPTVDRDIFRRQRDQLKALGYSFKPVGQLWIKTGA